MKKILVISIVAALLYGVTQSSFIEAFSVDQQLTLLVLAVAIYLWTASPLPAGASSILVLALMIGLGIVGQEEGAFRGFLSPALYFIVLLSLISQVLVKVGFDQVVAELFQKASKGRVSRIMVGLPLLLLVLPIFLPSAMARYKILFPLISKINDLYGFSHRSLFKKFGLYIISFYNQNATLIIFTGGGFSVFAYQLMVEYGVGRLSWTDWFTLMFIPLWIAMLLSAVFVFLFLKWKTKPSQLMKTSVNDEVEHTTLKKQIQFWPVVIAFGVMIVTWIVTDPNVVPIIIPPMLLVVFYALPQIGVVDNRLIRSFDWESFLLLGTSFSLGLLLSDNGTAQVVANSLVNIMPTDSNTFLLVLSVVCFIWLLRLLFTNSSSAIAVVFPIMISYADLVHVSPLALSMLMVMVIGGTLLIPIHSPSTFYAGQEGVFTKDEILTIGMISSIIMSLVAIAAVFLYW